jgi:adenosylmethionine-8-amino-7-oxononanoate aminotransferase
VRGLGLLRAVEIVRSRDTLEPYEESDNIASRVVTEALKEGVFFYSGGTGEYRDMICMGPPFTIDERHVDTMVEALVVAIDRVCR